MHLLFSAACVPAACTCNRQTVRKVAVLFVAWHVSDSPTYYAMTYATKSVVYIQVGKKFQKPAGTSPKQYERAQYMLDRLGLSVNTFFCCSLCSAQLNLPLAAMHLGMACISLVCTFNEGALCVDFT